MTPYHYTHNNPINRFDPDGNTDWDAVVLGAFKVGGGVKIFVNGVSLLLTSTAAEVPSAGLATFGIIGGGVLASIGVGVASDGLNDISMGFQTPDGMKAKQFKSVIEQVTEAFGGGKTSQKAIKLLTSLLSRGTNIPKNALNDKWIDLVVDGGVISQDLMDYLKSLVEAENEAEEERKRKEEEEKEEEKKKSSE